MRIRETCGCGASIDVEDDVVHVRVAIDRWRTRHQHDSRPTVCAQDDEQDRSGVLVPERDPRSTTDAYLESAGPFGFNRRSEDVMA